MSQALIAKINSVAKKNAARKDTKIEKALHASRLSLLTMQEFINITGVKMNKYLVDKFYHSIKEDMPIYLDNGLIKWCGYEGSLFEQKRALLRLIKKYDISIMEIDNDKYEELRRDILNLYDLQVIQNSDQEQSDQSEKENSEDESDQSSSENESDEEVAEEQNISTDLEKLYPDVDRSHGKGKTKHILIMPDDFRMIAMRLPTKQGKTVCRYYIELEKLVKDYMNYQIQFLAKREELLAIELKESRDRAEARHNELMGQIDELNDNIEDLSDKLESTADISVPPTKSKSKLEKFVLVKLNDTDQTTHDYYVIRAQRSNARKAFKTLRETYPNCIKKLIFEYQPNSINLYNRIKEQMKRKIQYNGNYISPDGISDRRFIKSIIKIHNKRNDTA